MRIVSSRWNVRSLSPSDLVACAQCMAIEADAFPYARVEFGRSARSRIWIGRDVAPGPRPSPADGQGIVASIGARAVLGFLAAWQSPAQLYIHALAVDVGARRGGLGRQLLGRAIGYARRRAMPTVSLHVWTGNLAAIALYRDEGFVVEKRVPDFYRSDAFGGVQDAYAMARAITPDLAPLRARAPVRGR